MASFLHRVNRRQVFFTDHALDRWWERCGEAEMNGRKQAIELLRRKLNEARWSRDIPGWTRLTLWHRARADGVIIIDEESLFVVNRNANGDRVAVTFLSRAEEESRVPA